MEPETQVEVLEDLEPERGRHPRGDEPRRRGRPRGRPVRDGPRRDLRAHGARRGGRGQGAARLPGGHGRRDHDDRVRGRPADPHGGADHRPAARAGARRRDDLLRLRHRRRRPAGRRPVAARPDRGPPETPISQVMHEDPVTVGVLADEDEVAQVVARYNLLAVPGRRR